MERSSDFAFLCDLSPPADEPALRAGIRLRQIDDPAVEDDFLRRAIADVRGGLIRGCPPDDKICPRARGDDAPAGEPEGARSFRGPTSQNACGRTGPAHGNLISYRFGIGGHLC